MNDITSKQIGSLRLDRVWPKPSPELQTDVIAFWRDNDALPQGSTSEAAEARARQLVVVAHDQQGSLAGVSTAVKFHVDQFGFPCFYYRTFVAPAHRNLRVLSLDLFLESYHCLNERFQAGHDPDVLGVYLELHNAELQRYFKHAVWEIEGMNVVYVGKSRTGLQRRVWYFDNAKVP